ncbi:MAG: cytochrome c biogenesis protein CcsA [Thermoanaerobaculia bacterium]|nr:cytochrome c biogenesis protein CcsA [Thermoanaerobaculia bacterium]
MVPLIGRTLILLSLLAAASGAIIAFTAGSRKSVVGALWARRFAYTYAILISSANFLMIYALIAHDFTVGYVAQVGSRATPLWVTISSLWSSLEGSILFWGLVLGIYVFVATWTCRKHYPEHLPYAIAVWLACGAFFSFLLAGPAQPFHTVLNPPMDGPGPNPLLQNHVLMVLHPPFLYLGYVGMTIPFGLASAALLVGRLGHEFLRPLRTWLLLPWTFLTVAIVMGGWWAYEVLGWGGYWAWDPVENASFLPWLTATAALHSALVMERRSILKGWTVTLVMASFLLTVLGTFMTRSGVFNSVHSFTQSSIGPTILAFLAVSLVWSVLILAMRVDHLSAEGQIDSGKSREGAFLANNLLFVLFTFTVLIGTVFPLVVEAVKGVQMSVGSPYFNRMSVPIGVALLFLMGVGPALPWGRATKQQMIKALVPPIIGGVILLAIGFAVGARNAWTLLALFFGGYTAQVTLREMWLPLVQRMKGGAGIGQALVEGQLVRGRRRFAAYVVHAAVVVIIVSIAVSSTMQQSTEVQLMKGQSAKIGPYELTLQGVETVSEAHREGVLARLSVTKNGKPSGEMLPRMNYYAMSKDPIGTPEVRTTLTHDLYLSIMNIDERSQSVGLHLIINPMVGWIWIATGVMALGGFMATWPTKSRRNEAILRDAAQARGGEAVVES